MGFLFLDLYLPPPVLRPPPPRPHTYLCDTQLCHTPSFTYDFVTHHLSHTTLSHAIFSHTHNFATHHLSHTIFHTQLCHTLSFHTQLCYTPPFTHHLSHTTLSHAIFHTQLCHTQLFTYNVLTHRSSTTSFVYPSFPVPLELFVSASRKKLTCGVIRSFNWLLRKTRVNEEPATFPQAPWGSDDIFNTRGKRL